MKTTHFRNQFGCLFGCKDSVNFSGDEDQFIKLNNATNGGAPVPTEAEALAVAAAQAAQTAMAKAAIDHQAHAQKAGDATAAVETANAAATVAASSHSEFVAAQNMAEAAKKASIEAHASAKKSHLSAAEEWNLMKEAKATALSSGLAAAKSHADADAAAVLAAIVAAKATAVAAVEVTAVAAFGNHGLEQVTTGSSEARTQATKPRKPLTKRDVRRPFKGGSSNTRGLPLGAGTDDVSKSQTGTETVSESCPN